jgi:hypothetical protein
MNNTLAFRLGIMVGALYVSSPSMSQASSASASTATARGTDMTNTPTRKADRAAATPRYTEVIATMSWAETNDEGVSYPTTRVFRLEFESLEAAERWMESGIEDHSLMNYTALADEMGD